MAAAVAVRPSKLLNLKDLLSHLTFNDACKLIGPEGAKLIRQGANDFTIKTKEHVELTADLLRVTVPDVGRTAIVTLTLIAEATYRIQWHCSKCEGACVHVGAAFSLVLEQKTALGLAVAPKRRDPVASLEEEALIELALADREERARVEKMQVSSNDSSRPWTEYVVTSKVSGKCYAVSLRGLNPGDSTCTCPDYRVNTLGTCKHVLHVQRKIKRRFSSAELKRAFRHRAITVHLNYVGEVSLRMTAPDKIDDSVAQLIGSLPDGPIEKLGRLMKALGQLQKGGHDVVVTPDAEEFIEQRLFQERMNDKMADIRRDPVTHAYRHTLLKIPLLPYQLDGIAFAAGAGRAVLADDMGLGKTIQGVGVAELLAREAQIRKVLVICPASVKSQWRGEIHRFCDRDVQIVAGSGPERASQYAGNCFFTICNYEQVIRDILPIEQTAWDLIILDEGQRIKNWAAKTSSVVKGLRSRFALVLSGTPLENRLDELYSVVQFIDGRRLGPGFRFFNKHRIIDDKGKVLGYKNLADLRETLKPVLIRRTRDSVKLELPARTTEIVRIPATDEQLTLHGGHMQIVASITAKRFITEMDLLRLQKALLMCRMVADSTFLLNKEEPSYSTKLEHLDELFETLFESDGRKVLVFSEWTTMLDLIEKLLKKRGLEYVRLDGSVPQKQREEIVHRFQTDPERKLFLTTNAGSVGLNLQAANTVINVDLPWNPAILEQRIARAHRMGQEQPVHVYVLVTEGTIEEKLLDTIAAKKSLALAALDVESEVDRVDLASGMEELKSRLEVLLGNKPEAPLDVSQLTDATETATKATEVQTRIAEAGGELLGAAFKFLGELLPATTTAPPPPALVANLQAGFRAMVREDAAGKPCLTIPLANHGVLDQLTQTLARFLAASQSGT